MRDLEVTGIPDSDATGSRFGIWIQPQPANPANAVNATIDNVRFTGVGTPPAGIFETAVYATNNNGSVTIQNCVANDLNGNMILLESQQGAVSVSGSSFTRAASGGSTVIFDTMHDIGATNYDQTGLHSFTGNTFSSRSAAINVVGGWPFGASPTAGAFPVGVTISSNTIDTGSPGGTAVTLINAARDNTGTAGRIDNAVVSGNTIASGSGSGIVLQGGIPDAQITGNIVRNRTNGISLTRFTGGSTWDHKPDGATISANQIVDNTSGLTTDPGVAVTANANGNWWGCNAGPPVGSAPVAADCDSVSTFDASAISLTTWAVLDIAGSSNALASGGSDTVTAGFASDNLGGAAPAIFANGTVLPLSSTNGSLSD